MVSSVEMLGRPRAVTRVSVAPVHAGPEAPVGLFVAGILVPGVRALIDQGGDILVVLDRETVEIAPRRPNTWSRAVTEETTRAKVASDRIAYPTDGAA